MRKYWGTLGLVAAFVVALFLLPDHRRADAGVSCSVPFNLTNGTTADASQVMANYNAILACLLNNTAASGANNDITSLSGLTTPLSPAQGGSAYFVGGTSVGTNTITLANPVPNGFSYTAGNIVTFKAGGTNATGSGVTLNVNGLGAQTVLKQSLAGPVALTGGEIQSGQLVAAYVDAALDFEIVAPITPIVTSSMSQANPPYGFDQPINLGLSATVGSSLLTVSVLGNDGNTPSATDPVLIPFRSATAATGTPVWAAITSALTINTNAVGASLGCQNAKPCRFWIVAFYNSGTPVLALWQSGAGSATPAINALNETSLVSSTAMSNSATSAGVFYTPNSTTVSNQPYKILGYVETTEATAGTYLTTPSVVQLFGPGVPKPGSSLQTIYSTSTSTLSSSSGSFVATNLTGSITPSSSINLVKATAYGTGGTSSTTNDAQWQLFRNTGATAIGNIGAIGTNTGSGTTTVGNVPLFALDQPSTTLSMQYGVYFKSLNGTWTSFPTTQGASASPSVLVLEEIMGSIKPVNDNFTPLSAVG